MPDHEQQLSEILQEWTLPDTFQPPEVFRSRVMLRISRRAAPRVRYLSWRWHLVPVGLTCVLLGLLGMFTLLDLASGVRDLLSLAGVDLAPSAYLTPSAYLASLWEGAEPSTQLLVSLAQVLGSWAGWVSLYAVLLLVFASFVGWLSVLWRATGQPIVRKDK